MVIFLYNLYILGSIFELCCIQNHVKMNHVVKRLMCTVKLFENILCSSKTASIASTPSKSSPFLLFLIKVRQIICTVISVILFVCVEVLRPSNPMGSCRAWSVYLSILLMGRLKSSKRLTGIVHVLSPETDNCPS